MPDETADAKPEINELAIQSRRLLYSSTPLSFWGGVDPASACIIDERHSLAGKNIAGKILALPGSRGSCSGSSVLLELMDKDLAPAALIFTEAEEILVLGALIGLLMFEKKLPIFRTSQCTFNAMRDFREITIEENFLVGKSADRIDRLELHPIDFNLNNDGWDGFELSDKDIQTLAGDFGKAAQVSMLIILNMTRLQGARQLLDVTQAHIDGCVYNGFSNLKFANRLVDWGARVVVPTTLNSLSVDQQHWREQGVNAKFGEPASAVGDAYAQMGARKTFTCAPYLLETAPKASENIGWAESNAVAYANSVLGARTQKYPDFLDICIAITGRAPASGTHLDIGRIPELTVDVEPPNTFDDSLWPLLGYHIGLLAENSIPYIRGLNQLSPSTDDLKAFSAAFATTSSVPMFHIAGITPEFLSILRSMTDTTLDELPCKSVLVSNLLQSWHSLNSATSEKVDMICLGNPHFSLTECERFATLCKGKKKSLDTEIVITLGREIFDQAVVVGAIDSLHDFGVRFVLDTCWCMIQEPIIPSKGTTLMTNSGKYAHYGPGLVKRPIHFGSLEECAAVAHSGLRKIKVPEWLT